MSVRRISVAAGGGYEIMIGRGLLETAGAEIRNALPGAKQLMVVTDTNVRDHYADILLETLAAAGFSVSLHVFPAGEAHKTLDTIGDMLDAFARAGLTRSDAVVALGGGVTGDMAGFAAAVWQRGVRVVQIPTTLLAQIDSSVGGKTGVNAPSGKNLIGAFHQPSLVLIDPDTLSTLPPAVFRDGLAEAVKYGCILDRELFERLEREEPGSFLEDLIAACVECKRRVVEEDERESGRRMLLNFGHTVGHALEKIHGYTALSHGQAVGIGMVMISRTGEGLGLTAPGTAARIARLLEKYGLPVSDPAPAEEIAAAALSDKKRSGGRLRLVLLSSIGQAFVYSTPAKEFEALLSGGGKTVDCCGLVCEDCPVYLATARDDDEAKARLASEYSTETCAFTAGDMNCAGCFSPEGANDKMCGPCEIRTCARERGVPNCGHCARYPCEITEKYLPAGADHRGRLDEIHRQRRP